MNRRQDVAIAGAGFSGAVLARELALSGRYQVTVFDERPHVAGNCHTARDPSSEVMIHTYGPHIFHTSREDVWQYVNRYSAFGPYTNRVKARTSRGVFSLPINLLTINQFFGKRMDPAEARAFVASLGDKSIKDPQNFEEQALHIHRPRALRSLLLRLHEEAVGRGADGAAGIDPQAAAAPLQLRRQLLRQPLPGDPDRGVHDHRARRSSITPAIELRTRRAVHLPR